MVNMYFCCCSFTLFSEWDQEEDTFNGGLTRVLVRSKVLIFMLCLTYSVVF